MRSNLPKRDDIREFFSKAALRKAEEYQLLRRVTALRMSEDLTVITARVAGTERTPYGVDILLTFDGDELIDVDGDCSCPMVHNCKHVAATLLEAFGGSRAASNTTPPLPLRTSGAATPVPPVLSGEINDWLEKISTAVRGNDYPADVNQRLLYTVQAHAREGRMPQLAVSLLSVRLRKDGIFSNQVSRPAVSSFSLTRLPAFVREADIEILNGLSGQTRTYGQYDLHLVRPIGLLRQIVDTGRAYWCDHNRQPLRWGESRQGRVEWRRSQAGIAPHLGLEGAIVLASEPPVYVDEAAGVVGPVDTGMPGRLAHRLLSAPLIPPLQAAEVARRLGQKLPAVHHDLLPAPPAAAVKINQDPRPVLRLMSGKPPESGYSYYYGARETVPVAQPSFRYGPVEIEMSERQPRSSHSTTDRSTSFRAPGRKSAKRSSAWPIWDSSKRGRPIRWMHAFVTP